MQYNSLLNNKWLRIITGFTAGLLFKFPVDVILSILYRQHTLFNNIFDYLILISFSILIFQIFWQLNNRLEKNYSWDKFPAKRFWIQLSIELLIGIFILFPAKYGFNFIVNHSNFYILNFEILSFVIFVLIILSFNLLELGFFLLNKWRFSLAELERFKKENAEFKFETLMNQINPHFLFNSLNTLSSLIYENQDTASKYIRELSKVYRYVLENKENELVVLRNDLEFLKAYVYLFELRFANMISFEFKIDDAKLDCFIAPMTIQLLIENSVKHNIISKKKNLTIKIFTENGYLVVSNNLQKKADKPYSSGMGLKNIRSRYSYLSDNEIIVDETGENFIVKIPLIKNHDQHAIK